MSGFKVHWIERDGAWVINYKKTDGKWTTKSVPAEYAATPSDREAAERFAVEWYANYARNGGRVLGFAATPAPLPTTRSEYPSWLDERKSNPKIKAATWKQNVSHNERILAHAMSAKPVRDLSPEDAKAFVVYARDHCGLQAAYSVRNLVNSYSAFLGSRLDLAANPFRHAAVRAELPAPRPKWGRDKPHIAPEYVALFLACGVPDVPGWRWVKNGLALLGGARDGELQGLLWSLVNLRHAIPHYCLEFQLAFHTKSGYAKRDDLKTENALRLVPLHEVALARLRWWHDEGWERWVGRKPQPHDYVFPNAKGASWRPKAAQMLREDLAAAGVPTRYKGHPLTEHALRRTFATLLDRAGVARSTITEILGHSDGSTAAEFYIQRALQPHAEAIARIKVQ